MPSRTKRIALTGGIASGKSLAGEYLCRLDIPVIDADDVVHRILKEDMEVKHHIRESFGPSVFNDDGTVNRQTLGQQVFRNAEKRKLLESWIHPKTREQIEAFYEYNANHAAAVSIIPLLFESGLEKRYDEVWLIETPENLQIERLMATRQMSLADAQARISSQMPTDEKRKRAQQHPNHALIRNTGKPEDLYQQIDALLAGS